MDLEVALFAVVKFSIITFAIAMALFVIALVMLLVEKTFNIILFLFLVY